jgi:small subunit ribosomal protein S3
MGQKVHPIGFRLGITKEHKSCWYASEKQYPLILQEDHQVRQYIEKNLNNAGISDVRLERKADQIDLTIYTARPGVVVGRGGAGIEKIRNELQALLSNQRQFRINVIEVTNVDADANLMAEFIVGQLERRVSFPE